ncbi:MAG TPA: tyrosine-type recombinase/integrase [Niallia sp.]|nr:tyrosine-type recombinase/integrase [Niallia sp.]
MSINTRLRALKAFYNYLSNNKLISKNPMKNIKQLRDRQKIIETLDDEEIVSIAKYIRSQKSFVGIRDYTIFLLLLDTGIRLSELIGIEIEDVRKSSVFIRRTKNLKERTVYPTFKTLDAISQYMKLRGSLNHNSLFINVDDEPLQSRSVQGRFAFYKNVLGIDKQFSPHILRHTYAKRAIMNGMDAFSLAALLGHSDLTVTKRYVSLWGNDLEEKAKRYSTINKLNI